VLLKSLSEEADLHPLGRFLMRVHLLGLLQTRLKLAERWKTDIQGLQAVPLEKPVFIIGMPRSGSTFLHELLAEDPENRAPKVWEVMFPVPAPAGKRDDSARRFRKADFCLWWFRRLAPQADAVYPMRAGTPHECVAIHSYTLLSEEFISTCRLPSYEAFLRSTDLTPAYTWEKNFLQHLQRHSPPKRWVLKSPDHVYGLEKLFAVFPDACVIQTHRNPLEVLRSSTDLTRVLRGLYGNPGDRKEVFARESRVLAAGTERFIRFRDQHPELSSRFIDVKYRDLVAEPMAVVRQIYQRLAFPLTAPAEERMLQLASQRSRYRGRRKAPAATDAALDVLAEAKQFERYCARFDLPLRVPGLQ
jgi:hypothetical protein